jgi:hypothetical protein
MLLEICFFFLKKKNVIYNIIIIIYIFIYIYIFILNKIRILLNKFSAFFFLEKKKKKRYFNYNNNFYIKSKKIRNL